MSEVFAVNGLELLPLHGSVRVVHVWQPSAISVALLFPK